MSVSSSSSTGKSKEQYYPVNNPLLLTSYIQLHKKKASLISYNTTLTHIFQPKLVKLVNTESEIQVVVRTPSQNKLEAYNRKFAEVSEKMSDRSQKGEKDYAFECSEKPTNVPPRSGVDPEGRPVPTHAQLFFPYGKNELYDVFLRL